MDCEVKDECANYDGECTNDDYCLCEDFKQITEESKLYNTLYKTIDKLREYNQEDLIKQVAVHEEREEELRKQISELKAQLPNVDKLRKECLQDARKEVFGPLTVGQEIFTIRSSNNRTACPECDGKGKLDYTLSTYEETKIDCPKCRGYGKLNNYTSYPQKARIHSIILSTWRNRDTREIVVKAEYNLEGYDFKKELKELFATEEECQACIDLKNMEKK